MYPFGRFLSITLREGRKPPLDLFDTHVLPMRCLPWDMDMFLEMNNGRVLTLYDLGRFALGVRIGLTETLRRERWGLVVAGSTIRYRARVTGFQRFNVHTRLQGWDDKFFYLEQAMWRGATCCNHALLRTGVTEKGRLIRTARVAEALSVSPVSPPLPDWAQAWVGADAERPWPPAV
jgi:acyl-CoA thioesterase FadM